MIPKLSTISYVRYFFTLLDEENIHPGLSSPDQSILPKIIRFHNLSVKIGIIVTVTVVLICISTDYACT